MSATDLNHQNRKRQNLALAICCLAFALALNLYFLFVPAMALYNADSTDTILWAEAVYTAGAPVNTHFYYASVLPFGGHLLMLPFIGLFGVSITTHTIGMLLFWLLTAAAFLGFLRAMLWSWTESLFATAAILLLFCSGKATTGMYFMHIIYYSLGTLFLVVGLNLLTRLVRYEDAHPHPTGKTKLYMLLGLLLAWNVCTATDGIMSLVLFNLTCAGAYMLERLADPSFRLREQSGKRAAGLAILLLISTFAGLILGKLLARNSIGGIYGDYHSTFASQDMWAENLVELPSSWVSVWSDTIGKVSYFSGSGLHALLSISCSVFFAVVPLLGLISYRDFKTRWERWILLSHFVLGAFLLFSSVIGMTSDRLYNLHDTAVLSTLVVLRHNLKRQDLVRKRFAILVTVVLSIFAILCGLSLLRYPTDGKENNLALRQIEFLEAKDLHYGYATFWNSNNVSVLSGGRVKIRAVIYNQDTHLYQPDAYQCDARWYEAQKDQARYFLMLSQNEYEIVGKDIPNGAIEQLTFEDFLIFIYDGIPFPNWE